ncbi:cytidylate kinase family protein [Sulfurospirillum arcachonense]|uniref:cytidylate kinase family protein n=1 Tax=Sulfurospirillum arcachonense TaxID=57666 RepID=UPI001C3F3091|nr:cytidylate kinase family protein [Sulfurospirillum arcachonense]
MKIINSNIVKRVLVFTLGLFVMALGVSLSVKANLGVSPVSCVPYVFSLTMPLSLGELTIILNIFFILMQMIILRKNYNLAQLVQLPSVIIFGYCIDFTMNILSNLNPTSYIQQAFWCILACGVLAFGIFLLLKTHLTYLPLDGLAIAISQTYKKEFGKVKISLDSSMVIIGTLSSFVLLSHLEGIREGSALAAVLVGACIKFFSNKLPMIEKWLKQESSTKSVDKKIHNTKNDSLIITISREYGSGGHEIGKFIAKELGISFYDKELIELTAKQTGYTTKYIQENEQSLANSLLYELYEQNYAYVDDQLPPIDALFLVQSKIIRDICAKESCIIVGRCANFILKDNPNCFNVFIHANNEYRKEKINKEYGMKLTYLDKDLEHIDKKRANYCYHYTGTDWKDATNYHFTIESSLYGSQQSAEKIIQLVKNLVNNR